MKQLIIIPILLISSLVKAQTNISLTLNEAPKELEIFGAGSISTFINERDFALSPDGKEIYFTISTPKSSVQTIVHCKKLKNNTWTQPEVVSFAGKYSDLEPAFSVDGQTLYFSSNRPLNGEQAKDFDIWKVKRQGNGWGSPENLGTPVNAESDEFYPSITKSGSLYFTATYKNGIGKEDIFVSKFINDTYQIPEVLDTAVNSRLYEFNAFVSPNEDYIIFTCYGRKDDFGGGDLYMSIKDENGKWKTAKNLKMLNSAQLDYCPYVSPDGKALFITSDRHQLPTMFFDKKATYKTIVENNTQALNGTGNIYWIDFKGVWDSINH